MRHHTLRWNRFNEIYHAKQYMKPFDDLIDFPLLVDIEVTNACNMSCKMCAARQQMTRQVGYMRPTIFHEIVEQVMDYGAMGIRFIRQGEPLLHRNIMGFVAKTHKARLKTHLTTNGKLLYLGIDSILNSKLDTLVVSLQGYDEESYRKYRVGGSLEQIRRTLSVMMHRRRMGPYIQVTTTINKGEEKEAEALREAWVGEYCDDVTWGYTRTRHLKQTDLPSNDLPLRKKCAEPWRKLSIDWNGDATMCCGDYDGMMVVGNIQHKNLHQLWHTEKANEIRKDLAEGRMEKYELCRNCELSHEFEDMGG